MVCIPHTSHLADVQRLSVAAHALTAGRAVFYYSPPRRPTALRPGAHCMPGVLTRAGPAAWCRYYMIVAVNCTRGATLMPIYGLFSSACRGTPFQLELPGPLLPFAQGKPQLPPSLRLPKRHGANTPAPPGELKAAFFAAAPPINKNRLYRQKGPAAPLARLTRAIHPAFCPIQQAGGRHSRRSSRGHRYHSRRANRSSPHRGGCRSATAQTHRPRQGK